MNKALELFIKKTDNLIKLLNYLSTVKTVPSEIKILYSDFYLKNIIINNYTNFENYLRDCLTCIAEKLNSIEVLDSSLISKKLQLDIMKKNMEKLPKDANKIYTDAQKKIVYNINRMLNDDKYYFDLSAHSFKQLTHSVSELEELLCKYFNRDKILYDIMIKKTSEVIPNIEIEEEESAFAFLNRYAEKLRHPIVHEGITIYMNQDFDINDEYVINQLSNYKTIANELNNVFSKYYNSLINNHSNDINDSMIPEFIG